MRSIIQITIVCFAMLVVVTGHLQAGVIYYSSLDPFDSTFASYNTLSDTWTTLAPRYSQTQMTADSSGNLYSYNDQTNSIDIYNPTTDSWTFHTNGPGVGATHGNLEITNSGRFLLTPNASSNQLFYSDGGAWSVTSLGFASNSQGDYDPGTDQYVLGQLHRNRAFLVDATTFSITATQDAGSATEWRRGGSILDGHFIGAERTQLFEWDLADGSLLSVSASPVTWASMAVDRENSVVYLADLLNGSFYSYSDGLYIRLANAPRLDNYSSIVFVPDGKSISTVPEPASIALFGLGSLGMGVIARRRKNKRNRLGRSLAQSVDLSAPIPGVSVG